MPEEEKDMVHHPAHYTEGYGQKIEVLSIIQDKLTPEQFLGYIKGNIMKYMLRANFKNNHDQDIAKAEWYQDYLSDYLKHEYKTAGLSDKKI